MAHDMLHTSFAEEVQCRSSRHHVWPSGSAFCLCLQPIVCIGAVDPMLFQKIAPSADTQQPPRTSGVHL